MLDHNTVYLAGKFHARPCSILSHMENFEYISIVEYKNLILLVVSSYLTDTMLSYNTFIP
jgi:hypothetical protein